MKQKAAIYCRLSKEDVDKISKEQERESIVNQIMMLLDFVEQKDSSYMTYIRMMTTLVYMMTDRDSRE